MLPKLNLKNRIKWGELKIKFYDTFSKMIGKYWSYEEITLSKSKILREAQFFIPWFCQTSNNLKNYWNYD